MKTKLTLAGCSALTIACTLTSNIATAEEKQGPYVGADLGVALTGDADLKEFPGAASGRHVEFDPGMRLSLAGGWSFCEWFRAGGEFGVIAHNIKGADATFSQIPLMANVEFRFPNKSPIVPFVGGGPGVSISVISLDDDNLGGGDFVDGSASDAVFAWQVYGGLRYKIDDHMSVGLVYKYFDAGSPTWEVRRTSEDIRFGRTQTHAISASFSMDF
jgi:opacity protein-like surface antigen